MLPLPWNIVLNIPIVIKDSFGEHTARKYLIKLKHKVCAGCKKETISIFHSDLKNASLDMQVWAIKKNEKQFIFLITRIVSYYFFILWMCPNWYSRYANYDKREQSQTLRYIVAIRHVPCKWKWLRFPWPPSSNS